MPLLRIKLPGQFDATHDLTGGVVSIGRLPDNTIQIDDDSVSPYHAELVCVEGHYRLLDLASTNLCFVDGVPTQTCDLFDPCTIAFGTVECDFDPMDTFIEPMVSSRQLERDLARFRAENTKLHFDLFELQRQIDILSKAPLLIARTETTPTVADDALQAITQERDELCRQNAALHEKLQTSREVCRDDDETPQAFLVSPHTAGEPLSAVETTALPSSNSGHFDMIAEALKPVRRTLDRLTRDTAKTALAQLAAAASRLSETTAPLKTHPINRLGQAIDGLARDFAERPQPPTAAQVWSLAQAAELITRLLDPTHLQKLSSLSSPRVLVVDDDLDLLDAVATSLNLAQLPATPCADSREAIALVEKNEFDLLILDVRMPGLDGPTLCARIREFPRFWKTPILFLTAANTLDDRAQTSLSGGNDFLPKPFNAAELIVKAETWLWKSRLTQPRSEEQASSALCG